VAHDWQQVPFVDVIITDELAPGCPSTHPHAVLDRVYHGMTVGCNCEGVFSGKWRIKYPNLIVRDQICDYNETMSGCQHMLPIPPVHMTEYF
jgi:hypothetical protein